MKPFRLDKASLWSEGDLVRGDGAQVVNRVSTDSRSIEQGDLFVALRGENFDGHQFAVEAANQGAVAMLCDLEFPVERAPDSLSLIRVPDTLKGLQKLATSYRRQLDLRMIGVTGSNGKTSTKEMIAAALEVQFNVNKTTGNLNNHIGVPLTLLSLDQDTQYAVVEMGMNHPGEIEPLTEMAVPDIAVITGIGWVHVEAFDSRDGIAEEKGALVRSLGSNGVAVLNGDDPFLKRADSWTSAKIIRAGLGSGNDLCVSHVSADKSGTQFTISVTGGNVVNVMLPVFGAHMASNAALAIGVALECGVPLENAAQGLKSLDLCGGRLALQPYQEGWILDDTYNASPDSIVAGMDSLDLIPGKGRKVALLGSMAELGEYSEKLHRWVGAHAAKSHFDLLIAIGPYAEEYICGAREAGMDQSGLHVAETHEDIAEWYQSRSKPDDFILAKGSRSMAMENVVRLLEGGGS